MQLIIAHTIKGPPVPWARARGGQDGQKSFFTAPAQKRYKGLVKDEVTLAYRSMKARRECDGEPAAADVPIRFEGFFHLPIPAGFSASEVHAARAGELRPVAKPDLDNWLKLPMDALSKVLYVDDAQVVEFGDSGLWYARTPQSVRLDLRVWRL